MEPEEKSAVMKICLFEDHGAARLEPIALCRPTFELLCGGASLLDHQRRYFAAPAAGAIVRAGLAELCRHNYPSLIINDPALLSPEVTVLVNARWLPPPGRALIPHTPCVGMAQGQIAYLVLRVGTTIDCTPDTVDDWVQNWKLVLPQRAADGWMIDYPWDLIRHNSEVLIRAFPECFGIERRSGHLPGCAVVGPTERLLVDASARVEPLVAIDVTRGPVIIDRGAIVQAFSRLEGPCYIGPQTQVLGAKVRESTIGPVCKIGGEVEASIVQGYSNKCHDGFLGHSYLGSWVNLAAGTQTSDLRNDYGPVTMTIAGERIQTGMTKVGSFIGDHTKTGLAALLNTGTSVGAFCNLLPTGGYLPRVIPSFCNVWEGKLTERHDLRQLPELMATVMRRRGREPGKPEMAFLRWLYLSTGPQRRQALAEHDQRTLRRVVS